MKKLLPTISVLLFTFFISACATSKFVITGTTYKPHTGVVKVLFSSPEDVKYEEIGLVSSTGGIVHEWTHLIEAMQKEAAKHGANAIIIVREERPEMGGGITYSEQLGLLVGSEGTEYKSMMAVAIRIKE